VLELTSVEELDKTGVLRQGDFGWRIVEIVTKTNNRALSWTAGPCRLSSAEIGTPPEEAGR